MKMKSGNMLAVLMTVAVSAGLLTAGCAGPSTRVLPRDNGGAYYEVPDESPILEEANPFYIQESMSILTASDRSSGSRGESEAARRLQQLLTDYGYEVTRQHFRLWDGEASNEVTGSNVVAVRKAYSEDADILIISTHHDTAVGSPGANDNASGVVTWLETARLVSKMPSDTEIRFVSVSGTQDGWLGSRYYVESLTEKERERIIGAIQLDAYGYTEFPEIILGTRDGKATMLGDLLKQACWNITGSAMQYEMRDDSDYLSFVSGQIPAVCITQRRPGYEAGTPLDLMTTVDMEQIARMTDIVTQTVAQIMSTETPSMHAKSRFMNDLRDSAYVHRRDELLGFGSTREELESVFRMEGTSISVNTDQNGSMIEGYQYPMKWFDVDQTILTNYYYLDGELDTIVLEADSAGVDFEDMTERLVSWYGKPTYENSTPNGTEYSWKNPLQRILVRLVPNTDGFDVEISRIAAEQIVFRQYQPDGTLIRELPVDGEYSYAYSARAHAETLMKKIRNLLPKSAYDKIRQITIYTDGIGESKGYLTVDEEAESETVSGNIDLWIDVEDALYPEGSWRDETAAEKLILYLYGQVLELDGGGGPAERFYARFGRRDAAGEADARAGMSPGDTAGRSMALPDFAESFMLFLLTMEPDNRPGEWNERIRFFYGWEEMTEYREQVRESLELQMSNPIP